MKRLVVLCLLLEVTGCHQRPARQGNQFPAAFYTPFDPSAQDAAANSENPGTQSLGDDVTSNEVETQASRSEPAVADAGVTVVETVHPFQRVEVLKRPLGRDAAARRNANLSPTWCARELRAKKYPFKRVGPLKGIATPVRVDGEIEGVKFRVPGNKSKFGVLDCRLALTLVDFARFLKASGVTQVTVDNFYRPNARLPSSRSKRSQHAYGLAIDLTSFTLQDGRTLDVEDDWGASTESEPCGPHAALTHATGNTLELRELVCNLVAQQIFNHHLTPSYNSAHRNHLHLDVKRDEALVTVR